MSLYDKASLVQIPSGTKAGTLYSVLPANGDGDFTHTRATSATRVNKDGLIESVASGVPRLDYPLIDGVVQDCPALLLEPERRNSILYSNGFDNSAWQKGGGGTAPAPVVSANQGISPDGSNNAYKVDFDLGGGTTSTDRSRLTQSFTGTSSTEYVFTFYAKAYSASDVGKIVNFSVDNVSGEDANFTLTSDWQRFTFSGTSTGTFINQHIQLRGNLSTSDTASMLLFGYQAEAGSYATSYIPTTTSAVTRNADVCNGAGTSAEFNDSEGVLFAEISALANDGTIRRLAIANSAATGLHRIELSSTDNQVFGVTYISPSNQAAISYTMPDATTPFKIAYKYKENDFALWVNGVEVGVDPSGSVPTGLVKINFDNGSGSNDFYGKTKQLMVFNEALTDSELEQITSWTSFSEMAKGQLYTIE